MVVSLEPQKRHDFVAVVVFPIPGQLDESNIGVDSDHYADRPRLNKVDRDSDVFNFKDVDADGAQLQGR